VRHRTGIPMWSEASGTRSSWRSHALHGHRICRVPAAFNASWTGDFHSGGCGERLDRPSRTAPQTCILPPPVRTPPDGLPSRQQDAGSVGRGRGGGDTFVGVGRLTLSSSGLSRGPIFPLAPALVFGANPCRENVRGGEFALHLKLRVCSSMGPRDKPEDDNCERVPRQR